MQKDQKATKKTLNLEVKSLATRVAPFTCNGHSEEGERGRGYSDQKGDYVQNNVTVNNGENSGGSGGRGLVIGIN